MLRQDHSEGAVSPVVAVILLVTVTVALSAVIGGFVLNLGESTTSGSTQNSVGVQTSSNGTHITATVVTGATDELKIKVNGTTEATLSNVSAGDRVSAPASDGDSVTIVSTSDGDSSVVTSQTVQASSSSGTSSELVAWTSSSDWNAYTSQSGVVHEQVANTDNSDGSLVKKGYSPKSPLFEASLIGYWPLMEDSGTTAHDFGPNSYDGSIQTSTIGQSGILSQSAFEFNGTEGSVPISSPSGGDLNNSSWTYSGWFTTDGTNDYQNNRQVHFYYNSTTSGHWMTVRTQDDGSGNHVIKFSLDDDVTKTVAWGTTDVSDGKWHHVVAVRDRANEELRIYVDGQLETTKSDSAGSIGPVEDYELGDKAHSHTQDGKLAESRLYDGALSSSEVDQLYSVVSTNGTLTTNTKSFNNSVKASLTNLSYDQNGGAITVTVTGSPGTADEESHSVTLDGASSYDISWANSHADYRVTASISGANVTSTPIVENIELTNK